MYNRLTILLLFFISSICKSQVSYDFESGVISEWLQVPDAHWQASTTSPINGTYSLRHAYNSSVDATDRVSVALPSWNPGSGDITWRIKIRHGWDPSGSNRWWVFLMCDKDANQMAIGGTCSGYAVGVNVTGSDDLLKIYRFDNGTPQIVLTSTLNWQTLIGKTVAGAIEVQRKSDGTFSLKASTTGSFLDLVNYGSAVDNTHSSFAFFGISYSYTSSADQLLWVDDLFFSYTPSNTNDLTSEVLAPVNQISSGSISSNINGSVQALDVMKFVVKDNSTSDILPTKVKRLVFKKDISTNAAVWTNTIGGVRLRSSSGEVAILNLIVSENQIELSIDSTTMEIPNGQTVEYTLSLYLKANNLVDGSTLKFMVDSDNHGFDAGISGSGFANTFVGEVLSGEFTVDVDASRLLFSQVPTKVGINSAFPISVSTVDNSGNIDKDFSSSITLSLQQGSGALLSASGLTKSAVAGVATWADLTYTARSTFQVQAVASSFDPVSTGDIVVTNDTTSIVTPPANQPLGSTISSLSCYPAEAVEVLRFRVNDQGTTDGVPTIVRSIKISRVEIENAASLTKTIGNVLVKSNGVLVGSTLSDIKTNYFSVSFSGDNLVITDGGYVDVSIWIYLKDEGLIDNQKIQLKVDAVNHEFTSDPLGSGFSKVFPSPVTSNIFLISIVASKIKFTSLPTRVGVNKPFTIVLSAADSNGNVDKDYSGSVTLSLLSGEGSIAIPSGSSGMFSAGVCTYSSLTYSKPGSFSLLTTGSPLEGSVSPLITCGDADGGVLHAILNPLPAVISSNSVSEKDAVEVIRFKLFDGGTSDGLPLIPSKINLFPFDPSKASLLNKQIAGFVIKADGISVPVGSYAYSNGCFEIYPTVGVLSIPDGDTITLSISIYLSKGSINDNFAFRFYIPSSSHGWESIAIGTGFLSTFSSTIYGSECRLSVEATTLGFAKSPFAAEINQPFEVKVCAVDGFGNVDSDFSDQVTLGIEKGKGGFSCSNPNQSLTNGFSTWNDVALKNAGVYRLKAQSEMLKAALSNEIYCGVERSCLVQENFEGSTINQSWLGRDSWAISSLTPINGAKSIQHKPQSEAGVSTLAIPVSFPLKGSKLIEWNFTLRNGDWDPSSDNYFNYVLMCDTSSITSDKANSFAVGINPSSGNDLITLWHFESGKQETLITSNFDWNANDEVSIRVGLTTLGEWMLWCKPKSSQSSQYSGYASSQPSDRMQWSGLAFIYTASRSGQLLLDDLSICTFDYPPLIKSAKPINLNSVRVKFTEPVNSSDASSKENYAISDDVGNTIIVAESMVGATNQNEFILRTDKLPFGKLLLKTKDIKDLNGYSICDSIYFGIGESGSQGRLVINEIMANPAPSVGLPEYEYVELYNPKPDAVFLSGWTIRFDDKTIKLPADTILPNSYAVLCATSTQHALSVYGNAISVTSFPALLNDGMMVKLFDPNGSLISFVEYSSSWYNDEIKKDGGWSLEKIDYTNLTEGKNNWTTSNSQLGGTPCSANSVAASNPDITQPKVLSLEVKSDHQVLLQFSEPMDSLMLTYTSNYEVDQGIGNPLRATLKGDSFSEVLLDFAISISSDIIYNLCINDNIIDFSGNHLANDCIRFSLPQQPDWNDIVINEVLFNPYAGGVDFVEAYNRSEKSFDLNMLFIANRNSTTNQFEQVYRASDTARLIFPDEYAVITTDPTQVRQFYHIENEKAFVRVQNLSSFNNDEGYVVLLDSNLNVIDELHYNESMHFKLLSDTKGVSLERINPNFESLSKSTWHSASQDAGFATPTYKNSQWVEPSQKNDEFTVSPETFSPDGDGKDDYLLISYKLPEEGCVATIRVFDSNGREVKRIASSMLLGTEGTLTWDGLSSKNQKLPIGIYVVSIEYFNLKGEVKKFKKTCVLAEKL